MIYVKHDTNKIKECGQEIIDLANQYETLINSIFERLNNIDEAWRGDDANKFISEISSEENQYIKFGNSLKQYGKALTEVSESVKKTVKETDINN